MDTWDEFKAQIEAGGFVMARDGTPGAGKIKEETRQPSGVSRWSASRKPANVSIPELNRRRVSCQGVLIEHRCLAGIGDMGRGSTCPFYWYRKV